MPVQGKRGQGDAPGTSKYSCSTCKIDYHVAEGRNAVCPLCEANRIVESLREQVHSMAQQVSMLEDDLRRARNESSLVDAMREALTLADPEEVAEIKAIAYRWRDDPGQIAVKAVKPRSHGTFRGGSKIALEVAPRSGESEYFVPSSVGGVAFVESYGDLVKARGNVKAMEQYAQAIAGKLAS